MYRFFTLLLVITFSAFKLVGQCPTGDTNLSTQAAVDQFILDYANCPKIEGNLNISGSSITDLGGLSFLETIGGNLSVQNCNNLTSLTGLDNVDSIGGNLIFINLRRLKDLNGLDGQGLKKLNSNLTIQSNDSLLNINALSGIDTIEGSISIRYNDDLQSIAGFAQLESIATSLTIEYNTDVPDLSGLEQIQSIGSNLTIRNNSDLMDCSGLCNILNNDLVGGNINISSNPSECSSQTEIEILCQATPCPTGNISLTSQNEVDAFVQTYNACPDFLGNLTISGSTVTDLSGLSFLETIGGNLSIQNCQNLTSLTGLENIDSIGGNLSFQSLRRLKNLNGLDGQALKKLHGNLSVQSNDSLLNINALTGIDTIEGNVSIRYNKDLQSIGGFTQLKLIAASIHIEYNNDLPNLSGLEQIQTIGSSLFVRNNSSLIDCSGLCNALDNNLVGGSIYISNNPSECSSKTEVEIYCQATPCPTGNISLITQNEVNAFVQTYNACPDFLGNLTILGSTVTDLSGLSFLETIGGNLSVHSCPNLTSLNGLENIDSIGGELELRDLNGLKDLAGLNGQALKRLHGSLTIQSNDSLLNINALTGIDTIEGNVSIRYNKDLQSIGGFTQLKLIAASIHIEYNNDLPNLSGLEQIQTIGSSLFVRNNSSLIDCSALCNALDNNLVGGNIYISSNPSECSSKTEIEIYCQATPCPTGNITLTHQNEVNAFVQTYNACPDFLGNLTILGSTVTDLNGLSFLETIGGNLSVHSCPNLTSLNGLENIDSIGGELELRDLNGLKDLAGLNGQALKRLHGSLTIQSNDSLLNINALTGIDTIDGNVSIRYNKDLQNIVGLTQLKLIAANLNIENNNDLPNLSGLEQIQTIGSNLYIRSNPSLSDCSAICAIINEDKAGGTIVITGNPSPCNTFIEVETLCSIVPCPTEPVTLTNQNEVNAFINTFSSCDSLETDLTLIGGNGITDLSGFSFLVHVDGNLKLNNNHLISSLTGFENLKSIGGNLSINANRELKDISQLNQLETIGGSLSINNNDSLKTLVGLAQLQSIGANVEVRYNDSLTTCDVFCQLLDNNVIAGNTIFSNNPAPCSSTNEIQSICTYGSLISTVLINNLPTSAEEGDTIQFEVAVDYAPVDTLLVYLTTSNATEAPVNNPVIIPAGMTSKSVTMILPDDDLAEESEVIDLSANADYLSPASGSFLLTNLEDIPTINLEIILDTIAETSGYYATQAIVSRSDDDDGSIWNIALSASDLNAVYLPSGVSLAAGETQKTFYIGVLDNTQVDNFRSIDITAKVLMTGCNCPAPTPSVGVQTKPLVIIDNDGPSLSLSANKYSLQEGQVNAGALTIERNTDTSTPLTVNLSVSDTTELDLPITVTIPAGESTLTIPIATKSDTLTDGNQQVSIQADATNFLPGLAWVIVTDINKPDLQITQVLIEEDSLDAEAYFPFRLFITNSGLSAMPSYGEITGYLSENEILDEDDFEIGTYNWENPILIGDTLEIADLGFSLIQPKDYFLLFHVNPDGEYTELLYDNNISIPYPVTVLPEYTLSAIVEDTTFLQDTIIAIHGVAQKADGTNVGNASVEVFIMNESFRRTLEVMTNTNGVYTVNFEPASYESGYFEVGASFPGQESTLVQDSFNILGVELNEGNYIAWELLLGDTSNNTLTIKNLSQHDLTNVSIEAVTLPDGAYISFDTLPILAGNAVETLNYEIAGNAVTSAEEYIEVPLNVITNLTPMQSAIGYYFCQSQAAHLTTEINSINYKISQNKSSIFEFRIFNDGQGATDDITVSLPEVEWMQLVSQEVMPSINSGDTALVILEFIPDESLPLNNPASGNIVVSAANGNYLNIPFSLEKVSEETGNVEIDVVDQYTYFTEEAPHLEGAHVIVSHYFTGEVFAEGFTNSDGKFLAEDLPEGQLRLVIHADQHASYDNVLRVFPSTTAEEVVFLEYQEISFTWTVEPTEIEDEYEIDLEMTFETNVPTPIVLIDMPEELPDLAGSDTYSFFATLTNVGLITAQNVQFSPPDDPEYEFVSNYTPQAILANQAIQIPITMQRKAEGNLRPTAGPRNSANTFSDDLNDFIALMEGEDFPCKTVSVVRWDYECAGEDVKRANFKATRFKQRVCIDPDENIYNLLPPRPPGGRGGIPDGHRGCGFGCPSLSGSFDIDQFLSKLLCNPCLRGVVKTSIECTVVKKIVGMGQCALKGMDSPDCSLKGVIGLPALARGKPEDLKKAYKFGKKLKKLLKKISCGKAAVKTLVDCGAAIIDIFTFTSQQSGPRNNSNSFPSNLQTPTDELHVGVETLEAILDSYDAYFGSLVDNDNFGEFYVMVYDNVTEETVISESYKVDILQELSIYDIPQQSIIEFIDRWNVSLQVWEKGVFSPNASYPNIIDKNLINDKKSRLSTGIDFANTRGFFHVEEMYDSALEKIIEIIESAEENNTINNGQITSNLDETTNLIIPKGTARNNNETSDYNPVCASVKINISQRLTMTREAFEGTLGVLNGHPTDDIQDFSLNLEILDENGVWSNDLFEIELLETSILTAIDGTGTLAAEQEGTAKLLFIPEKGAAPEVPRFYSFGGSISYLDPFSETVVTLPLTPVTLEVQPSPDLFLHYFMQRDIYGDDPLTEPIEPILPADLAVMIENNGFGIAQNVFIESAQPEIVDNEKGLAINFKLIGSNLQGEPANLGLTTIGFGNIPAMKTRIGQWYFTSDLLGHFTSYDTKLVHLDSRGNPDLSLVSGVQLHELIHSVSVYGATDDSINDFLVNDVPDMADAPDAIYLSQGNLIYDVYQAVTGAFTGNIFAAGNTTTLTVDPITQGWNYLKLEDPGAGQFKIVSVTRSDGQAIPLDNVWLSHVTIPDQNVPIYEDKFHVVDDFPTSDPISYTVVWSPLDPNPPTVVSIEGHPSQVASTQVTHLTVTFSEPIEESSFTFSDLMLNFNGGADIMDNTVTITKINEVTYEVDLSNLTTGNGYYSFTVQAAGIDDLSGTSGTVGEQVGWTQFLSVPVIESFEGLPYPIFAAAYDTVLLVFNLPIDANTLTSDRIDLLKAGIPQTGTLTITQRGTDNRHFQLGGLGSFMSTDDTYTLAIDLVNIQTTDNVNGLDTQAIELTLDTQSPILTNMVQFYTGGLDEQHVTGINLNFNEAIQPIDTTALILYKDGLIQDIHPSIEIDRVSDTWYQIKWADTLSYPEGNYDFEIDLSKVTDLAGNTGTGMDNQDWTVQRTSNLTITNIAIAPDLGFSNSDGITSTKSVALTFDINEPASDIRIYQNDNGTLKLLDMLSQANTGQITRQVVFDIGGHTAVEIQAKDQFGNAQKAMRNLYFDETAVDANWDLLPNQELIVHPSAIDLVFLDRVVDVNSLPTAALSFFVNNSVVEVNNWTFNKTTDSIYTLGNLEQFGTLPGIYKVGIDLNYFEKYSSGIKGSDFVYVSWELEDLNNAPIAIAGNDTTLLEPMNFTLDASFSYDPDEDNLEFQWYAPTAIQLNDSSLVNPSFTITEADQGAEYTFLVAATDGFKTTTDMVKVTIDLDLTPPTTICQADRIFALDSMGMLDLVVADIDNNSSDNREIDTLFLSQTQFDCSNLGQNTITLTAQDEAGNSAFCQTNFTIIDTIAPVIVCKDTSIELTVDAITILDASILIESSLEACGIDTFYLNQHDFTCMDEGQQLIELTVIDNSGNVTTCQSQIIFIDTTEVTLLNAVLCQGDSYTFNNHEFTTAGVYKDTLQNANQCDSILILNLIMGDCGGNCGIDFLAINDASILKGTYENADTISSMGTLSSDTIQFFAGRNIVLEPGFHAPLGSYFTANVTACATDNFVSLDSLNVIKYRQELPTDILGLIDLKIFPNPFSTSAVIEFSIAQDGFLQLELLDLTGKILQTVVPKSNYESGKYQVILQNNQLQPGIYFIQLTSPYKQLTNKVIRLR